MRETFTIFINDKAHTLTLQTNSLELDSYLGDNPKDWELITGDLRSACNAVSIYKTIKENENEKGQDGIQNHLDDDIPF